MTVTGATLTRLAGVGAVGAGLLFIGIQIGHPPLDATTIDTTEVRNLLKFAWPSWASRSSVPACSPGGPPRSSPSVASSPSLSR